MIYASNVSDADLASGNMMTRAVIDYVEQASHKSSSPDEHVLVSAQVEAELCGLDAADKMEFLQSLDVMDESQCGLNVGLSFKRIVPVLSHWGHCLCCYFISHI